VTYSIKKISEFYTLKNYKMRTVSERDVMFFANDSRDTTQTYFFVQCIDINQEPLKINKKRQPKHK
jgi:hypothetical protein